MPSSVYCVYAIGRCLYSVAGLLHAHTNLSTPVIGTTIWPYSVALTYALSVAQTAAAKTCSAVGHYVALYTYRPAIYSTGYASARLWRSATN